MIRSFSVLSLAVLVSPRDVAGVASGTSAKGVQSAHEINHRDLFELQSPFEFYDHQCNQDCGIDGDASSPINVCPMCPERYTPCNQCCFGGASSLKLRFHGTGCPGTIVLASEELSGLCGMEQKIKTNGLRLIDCACFDLVTVPGASSGQCAFIEALTLSLLDEASPYVDLCLVSISESTGVPGVSLLNLSQPLPEVIGIRFEPEAKAGIQASATTLFDTTCSITSGDTTAHDFVSPLFPGFGKFAATCPHEGFIDLDQEDHARLPSAMDHYSGVPPSTATWFEFLDGTSAGFWPASNLDHSASLFDPTFARCQCLCDFSDTNVPTSTGPTQKPSVVPSSPSDLNQGPGSSPSGEMPSTTTPDDAEQPSLSLSPSAVMPAMATGIPTATALYLPPVPHVNFSTTMPVATSTSVHPINSEEFIATSTPSTLLSSEAPSMQFLSKDPNPVPSTCDPSYEVTSEPSQKAQKSPGLPQDVSEGPTIKTEDCDDRACVLVALNQCRAFGGSSGVPDGALCLYSGNRRSLDATADLIDDHYEIPLDTNAEYKRWVLLGIQNHTNHIAIIDSRQG